MSRSTAGRRKHPRGVGRYARCLLSALATVRARRDRRDARTTTRRSRFHSPWLDGALLRSPVPMVVTLHDRDAAQATRRVSALGPALQASLPGRPARRARDRPDPRGRRRRGPHAPDPGRTDRGDRRGGRAALRRRSDDEVAAVRKRFAPSRRVPALGRRPADARPAQADPGARPGETLDAARARRRQPAAGRTSCPT